MIALSLGQQEIVEELGGAAIVEEPAVPAMQVLEE